MKRVPYFLHPDPKYLRIADILLRNRILTQTQPGDWLPPPKSVTAAISP